MCFWSKIADKLKNDKKVVLLTVIESIGSSPGRLGFKMFVDENGEMNGSIGGGFMEHKLVELSKSLLQKESFKPFIKRQIHQSNIPNNKSGMICSGEQTIAFNYFDKNDLLNIQKHVKSSSFTLNKSGISFNDNIIKSQFNTEIEGEEWSYSENLNQYPKISIIGAGHVGLSLSKTMKSLGFEVTVIDNRENLNTLVSNDYADKKIVIDYNEIDRYIEEGNNSYVVLVSFGFKTDEICMRKLIGRKYKYFGVMGSKSKMEKLIDNLLNDGFSKGDIENVHTPIGIQIYSKTPEEISISIAAEIIKVKNQPSN